MISVHETEKLSLPQIERFLGAAKEVRFEARERNEVYRWIEGLLCQQEYMGQGRRIRGLLRRYIGKMTGLSRAQVTRLVARYVATGQVRMQNSRRHRFPQRYTRADIELLAKVDEAHEGLSWTRALEIPLLPSSAYPPGEGRCRHRSGSSRQASHRALRYSSPRTAE